MVAAISKLRLFILVGDPTEISGIELLLGTESSVSVGILISSYVSSGTWISLNSAGARS